MDALGTKCGSEDCTQVLKIQAGKDAIACTKAQQAKEDVGSSSCKWQIVYCKELIINTFARAYRIAGRCNGTVEFNSMRLDA